MPSKELIDLKELPVEQLLKLTKGNDIWAVAVLASHDKATEMQPLPPQIQAVIDSFAPVFADPQGLPPHRDYDHAIALQPNSAPVNARPYRYSLMHKDEIEW
jgi:hypothetical protein